MVGIILDYYFQLTICEISCVGSVGEEEEWPEPDENKVVVMKLKVRCKRNPKAPEGATTPLDLYTDTHGA